MYRTYNCIRSGKCEIQHFDRYNTTQYYYYPHVQIGQYMRCGYLAHMGKTSFKRHSRVSSVARVLNYVRSLHLDSYFVYASSEVSGETAHMRRLA